MENDYRSFVDPVASVVILFNFSNQVVLAGKKMNLDSLKYCTVQ